MSNDIDYSDNGWDGLSFYEENAKVTKTDMELDILFAKTFGTPEGKRVLDHLCERTLESPSWFPGSDPNYGFVREGQNSLVREILKRINRATTKQ